MTKVTITEILFITGVMLIGSSIDSIADLIFTAI